ncbi:MAG: VOC family protein [Micrococcaceae bacterium]
MAKVTGFGGFFFIAKDPEKLAEWYEKFLGIAKVLTSMDDQPWIQESGVTAFQPFAAKSGLGIVYGEDNEIGNGKNWGLNFRVDNLDEMIANLEKNDIKVYKDSENYPMGTFASITDPEGNPIQLWQPSY